MDGLTNYMTGFYHFAQCGFPVPALNGLFFAQMASTPVGLRQLLIGPKVLFAFPARLRWFTITLMLQDLDSLAARLVRLVQFTQQLQAERQAVQTRVARLEQERDTLRAQLSQEEAQRQSLSQELDSFSQQIEALRAQAQADALRLQAELESSRNTAQSLQQTLEHERLQSQRVLEVARSARQRIDGLLVRLPGESPQ